MRCEKQGNECFIAVDFIAGLTQPYYNKLLGTSASLLVKSALLAVTRS